MNRRKRVLMTKIGLDGHDRGLRVVTTALREAGMEVIYTGPYQTIEQVTEAALQEDVDVIGVSSLAYDHVVVPKLMEILRNRGARDIEVVVGGIVPEDDAKVLEEAGVAKVFHPGAKLDDIVSFINETVAKRQEKAKED